MTPEEAKALDEKLVFCEMSLSHTMEVFHRCLANPIYVAADNSGIESGVTILEHLVNALSRPTVALTELLDSMDEHLREQE